MLGSNLRMGRRRRGSRRDLSGRYDSKICLICGVFDDVDID